MKTETGTHITSSTKTLMHGSLLLGMVIVVCSIYAFWWVNDRAMGIRESSRINTARMLAEGIATSIQDDLIDRNYARLESRIKQTMADEQVISVLVLDANGQQMANLQRQENSKKIFPAYFSERITNPTQSEKLTITASEVELLSPLRLGTLIGWLKIRIKETPTEVALGHLRKQFGYTLIFASASLLLLLSLVIRRTLTLIVHNESLLKQENATLAIAAHHDALTGLPNRALLLDRIERGIAFSHRNKNCFAVCFIDLDGFKNVNDVHGHEAGDMVLKEIANRLQISLRESDTVSRLGGDEFVLILTELADEKKFRAILDRILESIRVPILISLGKTVSVSSSIGITTYPTDKSMAATLLEHADQAMYEAKRSGKNRCIFFDAIST